MNTLIHKSLAPILGLVLASAVALGSAGCKGDEASCDKVVDHTLSIMPAEFAEQAKKDREGMLKKCEEASVEERKCALKAKDLQALGACRGKK